MRFAKLMEHIGIQFVRSMMVIVAFLPLLYELGKNVTHYPIIGELNNGLVILAIVFALGGTVLMAIVGIKLPGLEFNNQRVEAAYRKELVLGEDDAKRAEEFTLKGLFADVRKNYFRLYFHYLYFDMVKWAYMNFSVLIPYLALAPSVIAGTISLGIMQQITRAFMRLESVMQFLVFNWSSIVELISIHKRLKAFEKEMK